jgi:hypothetical protein
MEQGDPSGQPQGAVRSIRPNGAVPRVDAALLHRIVFSRSATGLGQKLQTDSINGMPGLPPIATEMAPAIAAALGVDLFPCRSGRGRLPRPAARRAD